MLTAVPSFPTEHPNPSAFSFFHVAFQGAHSFPGAQGGAASRTRAPDALYSTQLPGAEETAPPDGILTSRLVRGAGSRRSGSLHRMASNTGSNSGRLRFDHKEGDVVPDAIQFLLDRSPTPPWRQPRGESMISLVNSHTNSTRIGWHLWEIDLRFAPGLPPGWLFFFFFFFFFITLKHGDSDQKVYAP